MTYPSKPESSNKRSWSDGDLAVLGGVSGFFAWLASARMGATANHLDVVDQAETSARWSSLSSNLNLVQTLSSMGLLATVGVGAICSMVIGSWLIRSKRNNATDIGTLLAEPPRRPPLPSALLPCITSHRRLLPTPAKHAFSYPLIYMGIDLDELESHNLDLPSCFFWYGTSRSILGLRHEHYLAPSTEPKEARKGAWKEELKTLVSAHGVPGEEMGRVWMVTMPSYLGFVGVNPLSVYFCYKDKVENQDGDKKKSAGLLCVVLEVHNTFEERHLYVLRTSHDEVNPQGNHDHAWVFPRTFHVSPFNNRAGFYRLDVQDPFSRSSTEPRIKVTLNQLTQEKETKLYAALLNHPDKTRRPVDITISNILKVVLWRQPWDLFLTTFRILRQAWTLHYRKKLLVYPRPELHINSTMESEPIGPAEELPGHSLKVPWNPVQVDVGGIGRSIGFRAVDAAEKKAEGLLLPDMRRRAEEEAITVEIRFADPSRGVLRIGPAGTAKSCLVVETRHPALFIQLLMARTPKHFLLTAKQEGHTSISSEETFERLTSPNPRPERSTSGLVATIKDWVDAVRAAHLMFLLSFCDRPIPPEIVVIHKQQRHLANPSGIRHNLSILFILASLLFADKLEEKIFRVVNAKFIPGQEPWTVWKRTVDSIWRGHTDDDEFALRGDREYGSVLLTDIQSVS